MQRCATLLLVCALFLSALNLKAQETTQISGTVLLEDKGEPAAGVVVSAKMDVSGMIIGYCLTDENGEFHLNVKGRPESVILTVSSMMTETVTITTAPGDDSVIIIVKEKKQVIKEARIQAPKTSMRSDTLNFNVASFAMSDDRNIGGVLKRIPGIKVAPDGEIYYQNKPINKFYIEGLDLLQGKYGLATKNIDPSVVASVQVLENHQPIRVLKGMEVPPNAAINLKLRKSSLGAFFLTAQMGAGLSPFLYSNELIGMRFTQKQQNLFMYKNDNTGHDIAGEVTSFYGATATSLITPFSLDVLSPPTMERQHYMFNRTHLVSLNDLHLIGKGFTLASNISFLADNQKKEGFFSQTIIDPVGGNLLIAEDLSSRFVRRELSGTATFEKNDNDRYISNRTDANIAWNKQDASIVASSSVSQEAKLPSVIVENKFSYMNGADRWTSQFLYSTQDNALEVSPVMLEDLRHLDVFGVQKVSYSQIVVDVKYYRNIKVSRYISLSMFGRPFISRKKLKSGFLSGDARMPVLADSLSNDIARYDMGANAGGALRYKKRSLTVDVEASGQLLHVKRSGNNVLRLADDTRFLPTPRGYVEYKKRSFTYRVDAIYQQSVSDIKNDIAGYLMSSYRTFTRNSGSTLPRTGRFASSFGIHYKDVISSFFSSLTGGYSIVRRNTLQGLTYSGILCSATDIPYGNSAHTLWMDLQIGSDVRPLSATVKLDARASSSKSVALYQRRVVDYEYNVVQVSPSLFSMFCTAASLSYEAKLQIGRSIIDRTKTSIIKDFHQMFTVSVFPFKNASVFAECNHYYNNGLPSSRSKIFAKAGLSYKYKKAEWSLEWNNIFNTNEVVSYYYDDVSCYYSQYKLRPSEVFLRVKVNIF